MNLSEVIDSLVEERGLDRDLVTAIVCDGICVAYSRKFTDVTFKVQFNKKAGVLDVFAEKEVVLSVVDDHCEILLRKAKVLDSKAVEGDLIFVPFTEPVGRIEILTAKQIISGKIRELELLAVYNEFKDRIGTIITTTVHKTERGGWVCKVGELMAFLPHENMVDNEVVKIGYQLKVLLKDVLAMVRADGYQLILDRASALFVEKLIELEIPEVFEGMVEIKKIVRVPGYKTKAIVASSSKDIDPVGTCVGVGGARIKPILRELGQEKIDLIEDTDSMEDLVRDRSFTHISVKYSSGLHVRMQ